MVERNETMRMKSHKKTLASLIMLGFMFGLTPTSFADDYYQGYVEGDYLWIGLEGGGVVKTQDFTLDFRYITIHT